MRYCRCLAPRELECLALAAEGLSNKEIGVRLYVGERTVKAHLSGAMRKLAANDRTHAVVLAVRLGVLDILAEPTRVA